uniref:GOLD domain-containing protein n=1 Tax=Aplanochytrium stocchinoi TaxID=215587 RepID=A0A7S3UYN8_9STRA
MQYALVSVIKGVASLENDQLDECLVRLWEAEELAAKDSDWLGKDVVRGIVTLVGGAVQVLQHSYAKGVYNVLKSWMWIKVLQTDAVNYIGKEREVIRSCALLTLGIFNILLSLLPPQMLTAATYLSGFEGDRQVGLNMLLECWKEDGIFSAWGALVWVGYNVDTKTFLHEKLTEEDKEECDAIFKWAQESYENSVFFSLIRADFVASKQKIASSMEILDSALPYAKELKALEWAVNYKRGVYELADLNFEKAAVYFENSIQVYVRVGRRSMVPFMAMYSFLCYRVVQQRGEEAKTEMEMDSATAKSKADEMLSLIVDYKNMDKANWGRQDIYAFKMLALYKDIDEDDKDDDFESEPWPLLDLAENMVIRMRCTRWMNESQANRFLEMLQENADSLGKEVSAHDLVRMYAIVSQMLLERKQPLKALEWCNKGLALEDEVSDSGFLPLLLYLKAVIMLQQGQLLDAKHCVHLLDEKMTKKSWIHHYVLFKTTLLKKQLKMKERSDDHGYTTIKIGAGASHQHAVHLKANSRFRWEWSVTNHDIRFLCVFRPNGGGVQDLTVVKDIERWDKKSGPNIGTFDAHVAGEIVLEWDNTYSYLRSKDVLFRVISP